MAWKKLRGEHAFYAYLRERALRDPWSEDTEVLSGMIGVEKPQETNEKGRPSDVSFETDPNISRRQCILFVYLV